MINLFVLVVEARYEVVRGVENLKANKLTGRVAHTDHSASITGQLTSFFYGHLRVAIACRIALGKFKRASRRMRS